VAAGPGEVVEYTRHAACLDTPGPGWVRASKLRSRWVCEGCRMGILSSDGVAECVLPRWEEAPKPPHNKPVPVLERPRPSSHPFCTTCQYPARLSTRSSSSLLISFSYAVLIAWNLVLASSWFSGCLSGCHCGGGGVLGVGRSCWCKVTCCVAGARRRVKEGAEQAVEGSRREQAPPPTHQHGQPLVRLLDLGLAAAHRQLQGLVVLQRVGAQSRAAAGVRSLAAP